MLGSQAPLRGAALLFSISLLTQGRLQAAAPLPPGEDAHPPSPPPPAKEVRVRALPQAQPLPSREGGDAREEEDDELFRGVDPKALAAVLLQALDGTGHNSPDKRRAPDEERVHSQSRSASLGAGRARGRQQQPHEEEEEEEEGGRESGPPQLADLQAILQELQAFSPAAKRERSRGDPGPGEVLKELEEFGRLRAGTKRRAPPAEPWAGARKLRRQQQLEHQLLQRRYEELAESRRQAQEARKAAAEEERLADMASDLLLQYLLKGREAEGEAGADAREEDEEEEEEEEEEEGGFRGGRAKGSPLLFEDEEGNVAEDKRSNEVRSDEADDDALDPGTIDQLIELSSKLHLPAEDVIDIISDVEKQRKVEEEAAAAQVPPYGPPQPRHPAAPWRPPKPDEPDWNEVLRGGESPAARRFPAPQSHLSNYIQPRAFQPAHPRSRPPPGRREEDEADSRARDDELENYIEQVLLDRAQAFQ
ncbi:neurosecretory protein VGF [Emydura macquarii macquarii]|uniref:neurosecretory protein VGF n=1 Tax=Emydura macquarii macquarii TaxID=1129001 RepID=UPI00352B8A93